MKKRVFAIAMTLALITALLAGCASTSPSAPPAAASEAPKGGTITIYGWGNGAEMDAHKAKVNVFNEKNGLGITANLELVPGADYNTKLNAMFSAGNAPDVLMSSADFNGFYYRTGNFENLTPYVERDKLDINALMVDGVDTGNVHDGNFREGLTFTGNSMVIAYNMDLFEKAGVPLPTDSWTYTDFLAACEKLTTGSGADKQFAISDHWGVKTFAPYAFNGKLYSLDGTPAMHASDDATKQGIQFFVDLMKDGYMPDTAAAQGLPSEQRFFAGKSAMIFFFLWDQTNFVESIGDQFRWDIVQLPTNDATGKKSSLMWTTGYSMNAASASKDAAWEFIKFIALNEDSNKLNEAIGIPVLKSSIAEFSKNTIGNNNRNLSVFSEVFAYGSTNPLGGSFNELADEYTRYWDGIIVSGEDVGKSMDELQVSGQPILDKLTKPSLS